jgi:hypothetical protein
MVCCWTGAHASDQCSDCLRCSTAALSSSGSLCVEQDTACCSSKLHNEQLPAVRNKRASATNFRPHLLYVFFCLHECSWVVATSY